MKYRPLYYDTETTGIRSDKDRIIELAAFDPTDNRTFCQLINPGMPIPPEATAIHHISDAMVTDAPPFAEIGKAFIDFCGENAVLIAHNNNAFDQPFLENEFKRSGLVMPAWKYIDTLKWSRKYRYDLPRHSLQFLREVYGVSANQAHRALDDVQVLYQVFSQMTDDLPVETILNLLAQKTEVSRMPFGKHQGKPLSEIPKNYVAWLQQSGAFDKPDNTALKDAFQGLGLL